MKRVFPTTLLVEIEDGVPQTQLYYESRYYTLSQRGRVLDIAEQSVPNVPVVILSLIHIFHPAKVFMGDTGSMFLGGAVIALAVGTARPFLFFIVGIIYIVEALSVVLQVISFKTTGKRIFKMSPIHHHFEMSGWSEGKIVGVFSVITLLFCILGIAWITFSSSLLIG